MVTRSPRPGPFSYVDYPDLPQINPSGIPLSSLSTTYGETYGVYGRNEGQGFGPAINRLTGYRSKNGPLSPRVAEAAKSWQLSADDRKNMNRYTYRQILRRAITTHSRIPDPFLDSILSRPAATSFGDMEHKMLFHSHTDEDFKSWNSGLDDPTRSRYWASGDADRRMLIDYESDRNRYHHALANDPEFKEWDEDYQVAHILGRGTGKYGLVQGLKSLEEYEKYKGAK